MEINVNKGIISFSYEHPSKGTTLSYQYDINKNIFIGKSGRQVKTIQNKNTLQYLIRNHLHIASFYDEPTEKTTKSLTLLAFSYALNYSYSPSNYHKIILIANMLDSLNLDIVKHLISLNQITSLTSIEKENVKLFKEWFENQYAINNNFVFSFAEFFRYINLKKTLKKYPCLKDIDNLEEQNFLIEHFYKSNCYSRFDNEEKMVMEYYYIQRQLYKIDFLRKKTIAKYSMGYYESLEKIREYLEICKKMDINPQKEKDFFRLYKDTLNTYYLYQKEFDNGCLKRHYANQRKAFSFSYGQYEIVIPQNTQDIVKEGQEMHHCVGSYVNKVVNNDCYIVFVRNKNDLTTPYITAEIFTNGRIGQYYLSHDRNITLDEDKKFKEMFQMHLTKNWVD